MPHLFSYGTLRDRVVQLETYGRELDGHADKLVGFEHSVWTIQDPEFVATSGKAEHAIVTFTGRPEDLVPGWVFEVTDEELEQTDAYEPAGYERLETTLESGVVAWVYAAATP